MRLLRHWKMILGLMAIFGFGVCTGGVGVVVVIIRSITTPVATHRWVESRMADLDRKLKLSPEQKEKIRPIMVSAVERFRAIGAETSENLLATAEQAHADVAKELTPAQQAEFNKLRPQVISALRDLVQREINLRGSGKRPSIAPIPAKAPLP